MSWGEVTAQRLEAYADELDDAARITEFQLPLEESTGLWREAADAQARLINSKMMQQAAQMHSTASLLRIVAKLWRSLIESASDLGEELDEACAAQILSMLCTQVSTTLIPLANYSQVSAADIDRVQRILLEHTDNPPELRELVEENPDAQVLEVGERTAVVGIGDIDTAPTIVTLVSGVGSSNPQHWPGTLARARELHEQTGAAVVCWWGYEAPATLAAGLAQQPAARAGTQLAQFQAGLRARGDAELIVLGHSYGSVVAGSAGAQGMEADKLVLIGSPGATATTMNLQSPAGVSVPEVHTLLGRDDPIAAIGGIHGPLPIPRQEHLVSGGHSDYFTQPEVIALLRPRGGG